jgi:hypothetical protein
VPLVLISLGDLDRGQKIELNCPDLIHPKMSLPTYTEDGVRYDLSSLYSTVKHLSLRLEIQNWILSVIDRRLNQIAIGIPIPPELFFASWTLNHIQKVIDMANIDQLKHMRVLISQPFCDIRPQE